MIADIMVLGIIVLSALVGYKKGFIGSISRIICFAVSIVFAKMFYKIVSGFVSNSSIGDNLYNKIFNEKKDFLGENPPDFIQKAGDYTASGVFDMLINVITILILIVLTYLVAKFIIKSLNLFAKMPVISLFNRFAGLCIGLVFGIIISYIVVSFFVFVDINKTQELFDNSVIAYKMYSENLLLDLIF